LEATRLPTKDARALQNIGLLPNPDLYYSLPPTETATSSTIATTHLNNRSDSRGSQDTFKTTQTDISLLRRLRHPRHRFYTLQNKSSGSIARKIASQPLFSRQGLRATIKGIFKSHKPQHDIRDPLPPPAADSIITLPLARSGTARSLTTGLSGETIAELDIRPLRRVRRQVERIDLRKAEVFGGFETGPRIPSAAAFAGGHSAHYHYLDFDSSGYDSASSSGTVYSSRSASEGSEVEVSGGVALTEEAVETHTPDILDTTATTTTTDDGHVEVEVGGDVVMQLDSSIMAQV
jgi:hypothetical protein